MASRIKKYYHDMNVLGEIKMFYLFLLLFWKKKLFYVFQKDNFEKNNHEISISEGVSIGF